MVVGRVASLLVAGILAGASGQLTNCALINEDYDWRLFWTLNGAETINFHMETSVIGGFAALGLYTDGPDFDKQLGHPENQNAAQFVDLWVLLSQDGGRMRDGQMYGDDPEADEERGGSQDLTGVVVSRNSTHIVSEWSRRLSTGVARDHRISLDGLSRVLYSCHPNRLAPNDLDLPQHHPSCTASDRSASPPPAARHPPRRTASSPRRRVTFASSGCRTRRSPTHSTSR